MQKHKLTLIDSNFEEKTITLTHQQLISLNDWLNIYLKNSKPLKLKQSLFNVSSENIYKSSY
jgi:ribosomal protein L11 methylase PrmA